MLTSLGELATASELKDMIEEADLNGDGKISENEFVKIIQKKLKA